MKNEKTVLLVEDDPGDEALTKGRGKDGKETS
jgi:hypothetical protein